MCFCQWIQGEETEMINIHSEVGTLFNRPHINFLFSEFSVSTQKETADTNTDIFQKNVLSPSVYFSTVNIIKTLNKDLVFFSVKHCFTLETSGFGHKSVKDSNKGDAKSNKNSGKW